MSDVEVARRLRARRETQSLPIIAISGWGQEPDRQASKAAGVDGHLEKPVDFDEVERILAKLEGGTAGT